MATIKQFAMNEYLAKVIKEWKSLETQGWCGYSKMYSGIIAI